MSDFTEDLLEDLEELENSTSELSEQQSIASAKTQQKAQSSSATDIDSASLSLEAAKAAQEAAVESQKAADSAIQLSHELKSQIIDLSDSNTGWRQASRHSIQELKSSRTTAVVLMSLMLVLSLISTGIAGWLFYQVTQKNQQLKGEILDLLQTETKLFNKGMNIKVDQISSLIEILSMDIEKLTEQKTTAPHPTEETEETEIEAHETPVTTEHQVQEAPKEANAMQPNETHGHKGHEHEHDNAHDTKHEPADETHHDTAHETKHEAAHETHHEPTHDTAHETHHETHHKTAQEPAHETHREPTHETAPVKFQGVTPEQHQALKKLVEKILDKQQQLQASLLSYSHKMQVMPKAKAPTAKAPAVVHQTGLTAKQIKQLDGVSWLVRKQEKTLKKIQATLQSTSTKPEHHSAQPENNSLKSIEKSLAEITAQISRLTLQQSAIENQVKTLEIETKKLSAEPKPYSYQLR